MTDPTSTQTRTESRDFEVKGAVVELVLPGLLAILFFALLQDIALNWRHIAWHREDLDWQSTCDHLVRYGLLLWFTSYFFISGVIQKRYATVTWPDVAFHASQTVATFVSVLALGFIVKEGQLEARTAFELSALAMCIICALALKLYGQAPSHDLLAIWRQVNAMRVAGLVLSFTFGIAAIFLNETGDLNRNSILYKVELIIIVLLDLVLINYVYLRLARNGLGTALCGAIRRVRGGLLAASQRKNHR